MAEPPRLALRAAGQAALIGLPGALCALVLVLSGTVPAWAGGLIAVVAVLGAVALAVRPLLQAEFVVSMLDRLAQQPLAEAPVARPDGAAVTRPLRQAADRLRARVEDLAGELGEANGFIGELFDAIPGPLLCLDRSRHVVRANAAARQLFGDGLDGREITDLLRVPVLHEAITEVLDGAPSRPVAYSQSVPVERDFDGRVVRFPHIAPDGSAVLLALNDRTDETRTERQRVDFVANASHEIRTPLASLAAAIETLKGPARDDPEAHDRFLDLMQEQSDRMTRLVHDLLSLSRIELREHAPPGDPVALRPLLERLVRGLDLQAQEQEVRLELKLEADLPAVLGDEDELEQVLHNLIDNAIKYGSDGGRVTISAGRAERTLALTGARVPAVEVAVRDYGQGIAREFLPRLTERFYRVDTARSRALGGTGLGLAIVKHIINRHRGQLTVHSEPGAGTVFLALLPCAPEKPAD